MRKHGSGLQPTYRGILMLDALIGAAMFAIRSGEQSGSAAGASKYTCSPACAIKPEARVHDLLWGCLLGAIGVPP